MTELEELRKRVREKESKDRENAEIDRLKEKLEDGTAKGFIKKVIRNFF